MSFIQRHGGVGILTPEDVPDLRNAVKEAFAILMDGQWHSGQEIKERHRHGQGEALRRVRDPMRRVVWFSCGAASAVAARLTLEKHKEDVEVVYCDTMASEHEDNQRFFDDVQEWLGQPITRIKSEKYDTVDDVFEKTRYLAGIQGVRCTVEMKKVPRFNFQRPDDIHIFGLTADEPGRIATFEKNNHDLNLEWPLQTEGMTKDRCLAYIAQAGIVLPTMYQLGYRNNNCKGCVKATSARCWNMIRRDFPEVFQRRCEQSRELNVRLTRLHGERIFLDELPPDYLSGDLENISCGPDCSTQADLFEVAI